MWGVPQLPKELFQWMHPVIRDHVLELQKIAESAQTVLNQMQIDHRVKLESLKAEAQEREILLKEAHQKEIEVLQTRIRDLEARFIKDSSNSHKPPSSDHEAFPCDACTGEGSFHYFGKGNFRAWVDCDDSKVSAFEA